ncbi:MAG: DUF5680 domain-containing protein [Parcubacteria group bacterium]|jgi:hypothetical protein
MDKTQLKKFLVESNKAGYAGGEEKKWINEKDGSTTIPFEKAQWKMQDNYFGGEPYGGRTVVFFEEKPVWMMVYYGLVVESVKPKSIYGVLKNALMRMPEDYPFRGPEKYEEGEFIYENSWDGEVDNSSGEEKISQVGEMVYKASYIGGLIDRRK